MAPESELRPAGDAGSGAQALPSTLSRSGVTADVHATVDRHARPLLFFWLLSLTVIALDQVTKGLVNSRLPVFESRTLIPGLLDIVHVQNAGVAFGILNGSAHPQRSVLTIGLALVALAGIGYYARLLKPHERFARLGLSLILGGAVGNLIDRMRQGYVIDFVDVYWRGWHFWAFNVADAAITIGAVFVFIELLFVNRHASHPV